MYVSEKELYLGPQMTLKMGKGSFQWGNEVPARRPRFEVTGFFRSPHLVCHPPYIPREPPARAGH